MSDLAGCCSRLRTCAVIYAFMTSSLLISVPYQEIDQDAAFAASMSTIGYPW